MDHLTEFAFSGDPSNNRDLFFDSYEFEINEWNIENAFSGIKYKKNFLYFKDVFAVIDVIFLLQTILLDGL